MTVLATLQGVAPTVPSQPILEPPRPGSRADRASTPKARAILKALAEHYKVCVRPLALRRTDNETGLTEVVDIPCGARLASKCAPCAERAQRLRRQQIREGWHLGDEPDPAPEPPTEEVVALVRLRCQYVFDRDQCEREADWSGVATLDAAIDELDRYVSTLRVRGTLAHPADPGKARKVRSTRRREDVPELPRLPVSRRTVGKVYTGADGTLHQPSTLLTITLGSYGPVHTGARTRRGRVVPCGCGVLHADADPELGTPLDPTAYDYARAARDAVFFSAGLDRLWQNLRRAGGYAIQYAGAVELQKRLAPHAHFAMRGTLPRTLIKQVVAATYHQVWWPQFDTPVYTTSKLPVWDDDVERYIDPDTRMPLPTWDEAVDALDDPDAAPAYVMRLGTADVRGINHGTKSAEKGIRYITKYVTKDLTEQAEPNSEAQRAHFDRLHDELATVPCSPSCANWLLYGVQPDQARQGATPGRCSGKVHQRRTLGFTGRRVLVSRKWSGKTLADHRADNAAWVRTVLSGALADAEQPTAADTPAGRYTYQLARSSDPDVPDLDVRIMRAIAVRERWRAQLDQALRPPGPVSATQDHAIGREGSST